MSILRRCLALVLAMALAMSLGTVGALAASEEKTVLADDGQVVMTVESFDPDGDWGPTFEVLLENKTDKSLVFDLRNVVVDGIMSDPFWAETVPAGKSAYSEISWYPDDLEAVGIHYIETVSGELHVFDDDSYDDVYVGQVSWSLDWPDEEGPAAEPVQFDHGFVPVQVLTGDLEFTVVDYDPTGSYDDGPELMFYLANHTDKPVWFNMEDVSVNGIVCDPLWAETVAAGAMAYGECSWWQDDLEKSHIDTMESVEFTLEVMDDETYDELAEPTLVTLDLTGAGGTTAAAEAPAETAETAGEAEAPAEAPTEEMVLDEETAALMGSAEGNVYTNDYFGVTFAPPEDWHFYTQQELLEQQGLAAERFEGTEIGDDIRTIMDSEGGFSVMMAEKNGGIQNVNALVESLPGQAQYLSEGELLDLVEKDLGLEEGGDMTAMGLEGATLSRNTFAFAGQEHEALRVDYTDTSMGIDLPMYIQMVFIMGQDYVLQITITTVFEDQTADVGAMFTVAE